MTELWEPDYKAELFRRAKLLYNADKEIKQQAFLKNYYKTRPVEFIEDMCITYDPRKKDIKFMPFLLFPRQKEFIQFLQENIEQGESGMVEKCRDMGFTWLFVAFSVWMWLFVHGGSIGIGSRKQQLVDRTGDPDSIFEKMRMLITRLPKWLLPVGYQPRFHATSMKLINPENGATITGEVGDSIGRGGRKSLYFKDESAHYERAESIQAALDYNTEVQIDVSSVNGAANVFYRRRMAGVVWTPNCVIEKGVTRVFVADWREDPRKNQEWYDIRRARAEREGLLHIFAQEVDRDYLSSVDNIIIRPEWVEAAVDAHIALGIRISGEVTAGQDIADGGQDKNALAIGQGILLQFCEAWAGEAGDAPGIALPWCREFKVRRLWYDAPGVGSGFKTGVNFMTKQKVWPDNLEVLAYHPEGSVVDPERSVIPDDDYEGSLTNEDVYQNHKAQAWFQLRSRFYKTFRAVRLGEKYEHDELISIDSKMQNMQQLRTELSQAVHVRSQSGKTMVDKSPDGVRSPNLADAVVIRFCKKHELNSIFMV